MNAAIMSFDPNEKQSFVKAMKCMRAVESDSARKERQKLVRELCIGKNKTECA